MKFYYILCFISLFQQVFSQTCRCPINNGQIINGYKNDELQQRYKGTFFKDNPNMTPVDLTILTDDANANVRSIVNGKVIYIGNKSDYIAIQYDNNKVIAYDLIKDIILKKNDTVNIGTIIGKVKLNNFAPKKYDKLLNYKNEVYSTNLSFYYIEDKTNNLIHTTKFIDIINCKTINCENCQPRIYGM
jgi:hypothetical protein